MDQNPGAFQARRVPSFSVFCQRRHREISLAVWGWIRVKSHVAMSKLLSPEMDGFIRAIHEYYIT
jgi:hypothetical protein